MSIDRDCVIFHVSFISYYNLTKNSDFFVAVLISAMIILSTLLLIKSW